MFRYVKVRFFIFDMFLKKMHKAIGEIQQDFDDEKQEETEENKQKKLFE